MKSFHAHHKLTIAFLLMLILLVSAPVAIMAFDVIDYTKTGEISVTIKSSATDLPVGGGSLILYKVADVGYDDTIGYVFDASGTDFKAASEDYSSEDKLDAALAARLAKFAKDKGISGKSLTVGSNGVASASDLSLGLYLIVQKEAPDGYSNIEPFVVSVPQHDADGNYIYKVDATPKPGTKVIPTPTRKPTVTPTHPPKLPQTGQMWWPVFVLAAAGIACLMIGMAVRRRN